MVSVKELIEQIEKKDETINDLRDKIDDLSRILKESYLQFANLLGVEIGKLHKLIPEELAISIMINGNIVIDSGKNASFHLEFKNYNELLEYLLCMVRLVGIQDGSAVVSGEKTQTQVYFEVAQSYGSFCVSCGTKLPPLDPEDEQITDLCEKCYHDGET